MPFRILLICCILLTTVSCWTRSGSEPKQPEPQKEALPVRHETELLLNQKGFPKAIGYIRCGEESFPICDYLRVSGFFGPEPWGFWTNGQEQEMQISIPWFMLGKTITLEFSSVGFALAGRQRELAAEFMVRGKTVLQEKYDRKSPQMLKLCIPAELNQSSPLKLSIRFQTALGKYSELNARSKDQRVLGFGFRFLKKDIPPENYTHGMFQISSIGAPDENGDQSAVLRCIDLFQGPVPPAEIRTMLPAASLSSQDGVPPYCRGEQLELVLRTKNEKTQIIFGRTAAAEDQDLLGDPTEISSAYPPYQLPQNPPLPDAVRQAQQKQIAEDAPLIRGKIKSIRKINALDERFLRAWIQQQKDLEVIPRIISPENGQEIERFQNLYYWKIRGGSCFALPKDYIFIGKTGIGHNIVALHSLHQMLRACNVQLIVMLIPDAEQIAARALVPRYGHTGDLTALQCAATMLEYGMEAVYADDAVLAKAYTVGRLFCYPDSAPEAELWKILADLTAKRLERFGEKAFQEKTPSHYSENRGKTVFGNNYRWPEEVECGDHKSGETVESLEVFRNGIPFQPDPKSEILVIGGGTINLPGPGHSFSGQLSKRLKYPVDELALAGEVWFQNLPSALSRNPDRYLRGKKVCLLMVSPRMLTEYVLPDLQKESALYARIRGKQPAHRFEVKTAEPDFELPEPIPGETLYQQKQQWNRLWKQFSLTDPPTASLRIEDSKKEQSWMSFELPEKLQLDKTSVLVLETAVYPLQAVTVLVNGRKVPLTINTGSPHFRFNAVELPPHTKTVEIKISGRQDNRIMFRNILLYQ